MTDRNKRQDDPATNGSVGSTELPNVEGVDQSRQRGGGYGQDELQRQRDPTGADSAEHLSDRAPSDVEQA